MSATVLKDHAGKDAITKVIETAGTFLDAIGEQQVDILGGSLEALSPNNWLSIIRNVSDDSSLTPRS
jgi:hypothetical protein